MAGQPFRKRKTLRVRSSPVAPGRVKQPGAAGARKASGPGSRLRIVPFSLRQHGKALSSNRQDAALSRRMAPVRSWPRPRGSPSGNVAGLGLLEKIAAGRATPP